MECLSSCRLGRTPSALAVAPEDVLGWFYQAQRPSGLWPAGICGPHTECTVLEMAYILHLLIIFFKRWKSSRILFPLASRLAHWKGNSYLLLHFCSLHFWSCWPFSVLYSFPNNLYYKRMVWGFWFGGLLVFFSTTEVILSGNSNISVPGTQRWPC